MVSLIVTAWTVNYYSFGNIQLLYAEVNGEVMLACGEFIHKKALECSLMIIYILGKYRGSICEITGEASHG
jgi:hypothetical protein